MTLSVRVSSFVTVRQYDRMFFKVQGDFEPFPGGLVSITRTFRSAKRPALHYQATLDSALMRREIQEYKKTAGVGMVATGNYYRLTRDQLSWLQEINHLIRWGQDNQYNIDAGFFPDDGAEGPRCNESDFQIAELSVSAI